MYMYIYIYIYGTSSIILSTIFPSFETILGLPHPFFPLAHALHQRMLRCIGC